MTIVNEYVVWFVNRTLFCVDISALHPDWHYMTCAVTTRYNC
jgi:hypothetical protein